MIFGEITDDMKSWSFNTQLADSEASLKPSICDLSSPVQGHCSRAF